MARYEAHPVFELPNPSTVIWRYMGFSKFVALLNSSALYFTVASKYEDKGVLPTIVWVTPICCGLLLGLFLPHFDPPRKGEESMGHQFRRVR